MSDDAGPLLVRAGLLSPQQLRTAYGHAGAAGRTLVEELVAGKLLEEERLCEFFRERLLVPRVRREDIERVARSVLGLLPPDVAVAFRCIPLAADGHKNLALAMADPSDTHAVDEVRFLTKMTVYRVVAPASAVAWGLLQFYGTGTPLAPAPPPKAAAPDASRRFPEPEIVEDVYGEDTPIPQAVPFDETTGRVVLIDPRSLSDALSERVGPPPSYQASETALREAVRTLALAPSSDAIAQALVSFLHKLCRRAVFFTLRRGEHAEMTGFYGTGTGIHIDSLRIATLPLDRPSTFRDIVRTRLPYRGPLTDTTSRDFLIEALGWAPVDMLAVPLSVRDRVVGILYGDERTEPLPDDHLSAVGRAAELALERVVLALKQNP